jgi:hypothetical protein
MLPAPDLEAVAAQIDQTLSLETGRIVLRTAWAGRAPDGAMDALFSWLPAVKAKRALWERGQQLWTEQMTAALAGPCDDCREAEASGRLPQPVEFQEPSQGTVPGTPPAPYESSTMFLSTAPPEVPEPPEEGRTAAMPAFVEPAVESADLPTAAVPSFASSFGGPSTAEPAERPDRPDSEPAGDEHESHTMILSSMPSIRTSNRLVALEGPVHGRQFSLGRQLTTIGRSIGCHVTVEDDAVAYDHARIVRTPEGWRVELLGGAKEMFVNDEPVREPRTLQNGDVIRIGPARLRFESTSQAS